jgi:DNA invertase Pin-like site-specific DNA recombinase
LGISTGAVHLMHRGSGIAMAGAAAAVATNGLRLCPLGRSTLDALDTAKDLDARGVRIVITTLGIDLKTPAGRLVYGVLAQIAEFERELIKECVTAGIAAARKRGVAFGRRHTLRPNQRAEAVRMHLEEGKSIGAIARAPIKR